MGLRLQSVYDGKDPHLEDLEAGIRMRWSPDEDPALKISLPLLAAQTTRPDYAIFILISFRYRERVNLYSLYRCTMLTYPQRLSMSFETF